ncbi:MAG: aminotransferase class III-fold pyridoxal phosphate-dependent enzyme [Verrucomicrobiales bacterium]|nr:aminotransferase class III-fold pyridoxal phosphate-dependent enzyme [Verrucomicrobiales bacterium]
MSQEEHKSTGDLYRQYVAPTYGRFNIFPKRGEGVFLWDENGSKFLDFSGGVAVNSLGHSPPDLLKIISNQATELVHCSNLYQHRGQAELARLLTEEVVRIKGKCFFCNSGAEANEGLIKLARKFGQVSPSSTREPRNEIVTFNGSFHGRTTGGMAATGQEKIRSGFGPLMGGFKHLPFNDVSELINGVSDNTAAILMEPIQGEGGIKVASPEFLSAVQEVCQTRNILLFFDEVQCGIGRCGDLCGWRMISNDPEIKPDAISWAKGLGGGFPIGAIWIRDKSVNDLPLCDLLGPGTHGSTFGGAPLASSVALAVVRKIIDENICDDVMNMSEMINRELQSQPIPFITELRGLGLMLGFQIDVDAINGIGDFQKTNKTPALFLVELLAESGLLTVPAGPDVIRWLPPLIVKENEIMEALEIMRTVFEKINT